MCQKFTFSKIKIFQILLNQNLGAFSIENPFSEILEVVEGCFWSVNAIFKKILVLWLLLFGDVISKSLMIELVLCWDSSAFERFVDFYLPLFLLFFERQDAVTPDYMSGIMYILNLCFFHYSRLFEIWFQSQRDIDYQVAEYFFIESFY